MLEARRGETKNTVSASEFLLSSSSGQAKSKYCVDKYVTLRRLCRVYKQSAVKGLCIVDFDDDFL